MTTTKLVFETGTLAKALREVRDTVDRRNTIPILSCVLIDASADGTASITGSDMDVEVRRELTAASVSAPARFAIDAHRMADIIGAYDAGGQTTIEVDGAAAVVKSGRSRVRFSVLPAKDFRRCRSGRLARRSTCRRACCSKVSTPPATRSPPKRRDTI